MFSLVIVVSLEGKPVEDSILEKIAGNAVSVDVVSAVFAGVYTVITTALRLPRMSLKQEQFQADLLEIRYEI